jgi:hypothetical protein
VAARELFERIPPAHRRTAAVWPPIALEDPTEMIRSSEIPASLRARFEVITYVPYGGNILAPLVSAIRATALERPAVAAVLRDGIARERELAEMGETPLYAVFVARPRD